jgi:putative NADH-flavin reductase
MMRMVAGLLFASASAFSLSHASALRPARGGAPACSIAVFGASGGTGALQELKARDIAAGRTLLPKCFSRPCTAGSEAVLQALERGEEVTCLVRDTAKLKAPRTAGGFTAEAPFGSDKLSVMQGSVTNRADVDKVFEGKDVTGVVVALGGKTSDVGATMLQDGTANIIGAMKANGVTKISVVTTIGAGDSMDQAPWAFRLLMMTVMSSIMSDKNAQEAVVTSSGDLDYCIVRPGGLKSDPPTGIVTAGTDQEAGAITRADVAAFCLDAVLEPDFQFNKQAVSISSNMGAGFQSVLADKTKSRMAKE